MLISRKQAKLRGVLLIQSIVALSACDIDYGPCHGGCADPLPSPCPERRIFSNSDDVIYANGENDHYDEIDAGGGNDTIYIESSNFCWIYGGDGDDIIRASFESEPTHYSMGLYGGNGNDQLYLSGTQGRINLRGDAGNDIIDASQHVGTLAVTIYGGSGDDIITGSDVVEETGEGDSIEGASGNDVINAGAGNDWVSGGYGEDVIYGGAGDDTIYGEHGADALYGNDGDDTIYGGYSAGRSNGEYDIISGGAGNDTIYANGIMDDAGELQGEHKLFGEDGDDSIHYYGGNSTISGGEGEDMLRLPSTSVQSTNGNGTLTLTDGDHKAYLTGIELFWLQGGKEDDTIIAAPPLDLNIEIVGVSGGTGDDTITVSNTTGSRILQLHGDDGNDEIYGGSDDDTLYGGAGNDTLYGGAGNDTLYGGAGNDTLYADSNNRNLWRGGNDRLFGEDGDDALYCFDGDSFIDGGAGNDTLWIKNGYTLLGTENGTVTISDGNNTLSYSDIESIRNIETDAIYNFG